MLSFAKSDPAKKLRREIDASGAKSTKLAARLESALSQIVELRQAPMRLARDGADDAALSAAEERVADVELRITTLRTAIADEDKLRAGLEQQLADLTDRAQRVETADRCDALSVEIEDFKIEVLNDLARLADVIAPIVTDAAAIGNFARAAHAQLVPALQLVSSLLNSHARAVRSGDAPATLPAREPVPVPVPRAPEMEAIWLIQPVAFAENGQVVTKDLNQYLRLPPVLATKAVDVGAGVRVGDPRAARRVYSWRQFYAGGMLPGLDKCRCLDAEAEAAAEKEKQKTLPESEKIRHSGHSLFQPLDRGPAYSIRTSGHSHTPEGGK